MWAGARAWIFGTRIMKFAQTTHNSRQMRLYLTLSVISPIVMQMAAVCSNHTLIGPSRYDMHVLHMSLCPTANHVEQASDNKGSQCDSRRRSGQLLNYSPHRHTRQTENDVLIISFNIIMKLFILESSTTQLWNVNKVTYERVARLRNSWSSSQWQSLSRRSASEEILLYFGTRTFITVLT
jgi:hypothetical protein